MHSGSDLLAAPPSFTARRSAASNLPNFELPPPNLSNLNPKLQPYTNYTAATQPTAVSGSLSSVGNLLTPPSTLQGDVGGLSPLSSGVTSGGSSNSGQAIPPYTPTGYWQPGGGSYGYPTGATPQGVFPSRGLFSPSSLNSIIRHHTASASSDSLPPPPFDLNQLPPFQTSASLSGQSTLPALQAQQTLGSGFLNGHGSGPAGPAVIPQMPPVPHQSPPQPQEAFQASRPPPTPASFYPHSHSQSSSTSQHSPYTNPYVSRHSPHQASAVTANGPLSGMSPSSANGEMPALQAPQSPPQFQRPYSSYSHANLNGNVMSGPVLSNMHNPNSQMTLVGGMSSNGVMTGFNSGHAAHLHSMYGMHSQPSRQQVADRPFKCDQCVQSFNRNHDLKRHKRIHLAVKPFPCGHCDKSFSRKDALKRHILVKGCGKAHADDDHDGSESPPSKSEPSEPSNSPPLIRRES